jgi:hypothetical protein
VSDAPTLGGPPTRLLSDRVPAVSPVEPPAHADVFNDPEAYATLTDGFLPKNIAAAMALSAFAAMLAFATNRALTGAWTRLGLGGAAASVALLALATTLTVLTREPLLAKDRDRFWLTLTAQGAAHLTWLYLLCLLVESFFSLLGFGALLAWIFNDTRYLYDSALLRRQYLAPAVLLDLGLGAAWLARPDLIAALMPARGGVLVFGAVQLGLIALTQGLIITVGRQNRDRDQRAREMRDLTRQLAVYRTEREVLERAARLMTTGLTSAKFAHDVASPLSALNLSLERLRQLVRERVTQGEALDADERADFEENFETAEIAHARIHAMADAHATALKRRDPVEPEPIDTLVARAWREALATLETHGERSVATPQITLAPSPVFVTAGHASTLANLLTNSALVRPDHALEVRGEVCDASFYRLVIRDHGASIEERPLALSRIQRALSLDGDAPERDAPRRYRGYGIALSIARVLLVRYSGWLSARAPDEGVGVVFCVVLPRVNPESIADADLRPELHAQ